MDYGHTKAKSIFLRSPSSNANHNKIFGINIWDVNIKADFFVEMMVELWKTRIGDSLHQNGS